MEAEWRHGAFVCISRAKLTVTRRVFEGGSGCINGGRSERSRDREDFEWLDDVRDRGGVSRLGDVGKSILLLMVSTQSAVRGLLV